MLNSCNTCGAEISRLTRILARRETKIKKLETQIKEFNDQMDAIKSVALALDEYSTQYGPLS